MHNNQVKIISTFVEYILQQSRLEYNFNIEDVTEATINNGALYITIGSSRREVIMLYGNVASEE